MFDENKMTALGSSVPADEGQSEICTDTILSENNSDDNNFEEERELYFRKIYRMNDPDYIHTISLSELYDTVYKSRMPIIDGLLYTGAYILAGAPKIGKSFLVAQIAYHVSTGQALWGYDVKKGSVLYLALEDDYQRLQERMSRMFGVEAISDLFFAVCANQIGRGLENQLKYFITEYPNTKLIIVDTLQKVRENASDAYSYAGDYDIISKLKEFGDRYGICVLIVHHTRKQPSGDSFEMISGTTGLLGCADGAFLMQKEKRTDDQATLDVVGRDQPDQRIYLSRDKEHLVWCFEKADKEFRKPPIEPLIEQVSKLVTIEKPEWKGTATQLAEILKENISLNVLSRKLNVSAGRLLQDFNINYETKRTRTGSHITLTLQSDIIKK